jgi:hypothetical protein
VHPVRRFLFPRGLPLSPSTRAVLATLVERMAAALGFLLSVLAAIVVPKSWPLANTVVPTFFLMGCGCLLPALTLWRAAAAVHACSTQGRVTCACSRPTIRLAGMSGRVSRAGSRHIHARGGRTPERTGFEWCRRRGRRLGTSCGLCAIVRR